MDVQVNGVYAGIGTGNWESFASMKFDIQRIYAAAELWKKAIEGVDKPWLCWNVSDRWCQLQQRLIQKYGWTPVVGYDPRVGPPPLEGNAVVINFNKGFEFPVMWPQFPLEFAFRWAPKKLAFWHADLLCRYPVMEQLVSLFDSLQDGEMAAVLDKGGIRNSFNFRNHRFWEVCGCTTQAASENQFCNGTGWWRHFELHIKCVLPLEKERRKHLSYDSGAGIYYWKKNYYGSIKEISSRLIDEGHCSEIKAKNYKEAADHLTPMRSLQSEIDANYRIEEVAARLGIADLL